MIEISLMLAKYQIIYMISFYKMYKILLCLNDKEADKETFNESRN